MVLSAKMGRCPVVVTGDWGAVAASPVTRTYIAKTCIFWHGEGPKRHDKKRAASSDKGFVAAYHYFAFCLADCVCAASELIKGNRLKMSCFEMQMWKCAWGC